MIAFEYNYAGRGRGERTYIRTAPEEMKSPSHFKMQCICVADAFAIQYKIQYTAMIYSGELSEEYGLNKRETDIERERGRKGEECTSGLMFNHALNYLFLFAVC